MILIIRLPLLCECVCVCVLHAHFFQEKQTHPATFQLLSLQRWPYTAQHRLYVARGEETSPTSLLQLVPCGLWRQVEQERLIATRTTATGLSVQLTRTGLKLPPPWFHVHTHTVWSRYGRCQTQHTIHSNSLQ